MFTKKNIQKKVSIVLTAVSIGLLLANLYSYAFVGFFLIALIITFLKKYELKRMLLLLSPIIVYPMIVYCIGRNRWMFDALLMPMSSYAVSYWVFTLTPPILFGALYAYLFRETFTTWIEPKYRKILLIETNLLVAIAALVSPIVTMCEAVNLMEFNLKLWQVRSCQISGLYHTEIADTLSGYATAIQIGVFVPLIIILIGMAYQYSGYREPSGK